MAKKDRFLLLFPNDLPRQARNTFLDLKKVLLVRSIVLKQAYINEMGFTG